MWILMRIMSFFSCKLGTTRAMIDSIYLRDTSWYAHSEYGNADILIHHGYSTLWTMGMCPSSDGVSSLCDLILEYLWCESPERMRISRDVGSDKFISILHYSDSDTGNGRSALYRWSFTGCRK